MADHESISETEDVQRPTPGVGLEANRVSSDYLSCEIPEGWEATYHGEGFSPLFQMSPKESGPRDDVWIDCEMGFDKDLHLENRWDTPESRLATTKSVYFSPHSIGCYFLTPLDYHTVEAHGCKCAVIQVATSNNVGLAFNIYPDGPRQPILHATFGSWNNDRLDEARELVDRLAKSICVYESDTPSYVRDLQECLGSQIDPDHLFEVIARYGSVLEGIKKETPDIARFVKQAYKADQRTEHERLIAAVEEYAESNKSIEPYLELLADVADAQARYLKEDRANLDKLRQIVAETSKSSIFFPNLLPRDFRKLPQQEWEEVERVLAPSERMRTILSRIGIEWPDSDNVDDGNSDNDAVVPDLPTVMLTLLSDDYVFFQNNEISWSKGHHVIKGLQVNSPKQRDLATIAAENGFDDINDLLNYFIAFMREVEKDEALVVPRASISKALHPIVRRGDLTGITLVNLTASKAFRVINDSPNSYTVMYDDALADGIPHFFDLMCRLLWDLRQCVETLKDAPFQVTFTSCRNLDLSQLLRGSVSRVDGAQDNPGTVSVSEAPKIGHGSASASEGKAKSAGKGATRKSKPKPAAAPKSVPVAVTKPEPKPKPESKPKPKPEPEPAPMPKPAAKPKPRPATKPEPAESHNVNPMLLLTLLADDYVFFQDTDIAWERGHHVIRGMQANLPKIEELNAIVRENGFDSFAELGDRLVSFLLEVEKDKALVVPRDRVSKALYPIMFDGDLTGITLANLAASMAAFRVLNDRPNNYTVVYDGTLADGIPHFFDLMCRLLWDLRLCMTSLKGVPFRVTFARCRNLDLSQLLKGHVSRVNGAQDDPVSVTVSEEPAIGLEAVASKEPSVKLEAAKAEEAPADEEGPSVELQTPDVPTLVMSLLSDGYVSFEDSDIPRKKGHHAIAGVGVSEQKREDLALIARQNGFDNANELIDYFVSALQEVEKDEAFFVPKKTGINKGLYRIVRKGDLTGITFANMANYTDSFRIKSEGPDAYQVEYSEPVAIGLPRFFGMVCRLIWDLRQCENAQRGIPFSVRFSRIGIEFNCIGRMSVWWEYPKVTFVDGAQDDPALVNVTSAPSTDLTEGIEIVGEQPAGAAAEADSMDIPATMLALLSNGYVSFGEKDLSWSKGNHVICGLQIGSPVHPRLATLARVNGFKNTDNLLEHFMAFMREVEKDEALVVPRASISKALHPIVRRGDLTGITLVNLTASKAFRVINDSPNSYTVMYDDALADGIPHFFDLMCRLLWDLRQCVETLKDAPFQVTFTSCRNLDLSQLLRGSVSRVDGAQDNPGTVSVSEAPKIGHGSASASEGKAKSAGKGATRKSKPKPAAAPKSVPVAVTKPEPKPKPESKPKPKPEPEPAPMPKPAAKPKPRPATKPEPAESHNVNPMLLLTLLADDYVFFQDTDIAWERGHHVIRGMQANLPKIEELNAIVRENGFDSFAELGDRLVSFLLEVEKDKALVVPRDRVSKALYPIMFDGDLTGITLANLAASMAAFRVLNDRPNNYTVVYDGTLADGIPHFFDLMCRLLWDLRLCITSLKGTPFQVTFARCHNLDLSQLLEGNVSRVDGAQDDPFSVTVSEKPAIGLEAVASEEPPAKAPSDLTSKCERLEAVLDLLLAASTEHHKASRALFANEQSAAEDKEELRRIADYKNHLEEQLGSAKEEKLRLEKKLAKLLVRKSDLQGERDQLSTEINQLEEKMRELEANRKSLPFYAIFKSSQLSSKIAELADQKNEHLDRIKAIDEKLNAITCADIEKQIQDQERKIASLPEEIEAQPQKEGEYKSRLEKTKKDHRNLAFKTTRATKKMVEALGRYNDYVGSLSFTNTERRSDEYRSLRGHVASLISQLKEQGITAADRRAFPRLKPPMR